MKIEVLYFRGCPSIQPLERMISELLREEALDATVEFKEVRTAKEAKERRFPGSPTIRFDGVDFEERKWREEDYGLQCRVYNNDGILMSWPSKKDLRAAIHRAGDEEFLRTISDRRSGGCC